MKFLRANTQVIVTIGPAVAVGDGFTPVTTLTLSGADEAELMKHGSTTVTDISGATWAAVTGMDGYYSLTLTTSHTDTEGMIDIAVQDDSLCLPIKQEFMVLAQAAYDSMFVAKDTGYMDVNVKAVSEDTTAADNLELACDNYSATRGLAGTALPAAAADAAGGLPVSDAGGLDLDSMNGNVSSILTDTTEIGTAGAGLTNINLPDQTMNITGNITGNLSGSVGSVTGNINTAAGTIQTLDALDTAQDTQQALTQGLIKYSGPYGPGVYYDDSAGNTNTTLGTDGTFNNPVSSLAAATTIAAALGALRIYITNSSTLALTGQTLTGYEFIGIGLVSSNILNLGTAASQSVLTSCIIRHVYLYGQHDFSDRLEIWDCAIDDAPAAEVTKLRCWARGCALVGNFQLDTSDDNIFDLCLSGVAGNSYPVITATGSAGTVVFRHYSGGIGFQSLSASHTGSVETDGQVVFESGCNVNATFALRGNLTIVDNTAGMNNLTITATAQNLNDKIDAVPTAAEINTEMDTALADIHLDHLLAVDYDPASKPGVATALLNELIENDGGVSRYTANALEQAPTGGSAPTAAQIADAVWEEAIADHSGTAGSTAEALSNASAPTAAAVADAVWDEAIAGHLTTGTTGAALNSAAAGSSLGAGAIEHTVNINDGSNPLDGAEVWITTDSAGANVVAYGVTDALGQITFMLDAGDYYVWKQLAGYTFTNPETVTVS